MAFTAKDVKALRDRTNAGMMDCKHALKETDGDMEAAVTWLREKGIASAAKRAHRTATQGAVFSYIHMGGKIGVLAEVNCETDFVARCDEFQEFGKDVCLQVCSVAPQFVRREDVPEHVLEAEREVHRARARETGKPEKILDKIAEGMLNKWFKEVCLLEQPFVKDPDKDIETLRKELSGKLGENIIVRRFERFVLGECAADETPEEA
ncbi:MAG TPA: translation elongation factor Ts [Candidatus Hydrogenedentes bacterium]|nr:translation elongation factor Ts [Candidatus Hydrogenedentota bacterium]